jgi:hypothetical protein
MFRSVTLIKVDFLSANTKFTQEIEGAGNVNHRLINLQH